MDLRLSNLDFPLNLTRHPSLSAVSKIYFPKFAVHSTLSAHNQKVSVKHRRNRPHCPKKAATGAPQTGRTGQKKHQKYRFHPIPKKTSMLHQNQQIRPIEIKDLRIFES
jgi:hypothetical protein